MNANMLLAEIKLKGLSMSEFLAAIKMHKETWSKKIRGLTEFHRDEIQNIIQTLKLTDEQIVLIFFTEKFCKRNKRTVIKR